MNTKIIVFLTIILVVPMISATCYRGKDGFVCVEGKKEYRLSDLQVKPKERYLVPVYNPNPYKASFYSDPTYSRGDSTDRAMGNR